MSGSNVTASGVFVEVHDTFQFPYVDCRVNWTWGGQTMTLPVMVQKANLANPQTYTRAELAAECANMLGFPVTVYEDPNASMAAPEE